MMPIKKPYIGKQEFFSFQILAIIFLLALMANLTQANEKIKNAASPYVSMHADDPIHWLEWNRDALIQAKKENKPIYLTIGYFSCYWCHVLQRESFKSQAIAKTLNDNFISVVVDRELHPVLDMRLMSFAEKTIGRGGWPLNVVITPEGYPFMATIYLPEKNFQSWLQQVNELWQEDPAYIRTVAEEAANELNVDFTLKKDKVTDKQIKVITQTFHRDLLRTVDEMEGGFGNSAKFPLASILQSELTLYEQSKSEVLKEHILLTLTNMFERGMYDHLEGGFFRYTTDPSWQIPHFEKMLYDNAQLTSLYLRAGKIFNNPHFTEIGEQTLDFMLQHLKNPEGGFYSSFSAVDGSGIEGGYYVFDKAHWEKILAKDEVQVLKLAWDWESPPVIDEGHLPVYVNNMPELMAKTKFSKMKIEKLLNSAKEKLLQVRKTRELPRDDKIITAWNALSLIALTDAYEATGNLKYKDAAKKLVHFLEQNLIQANKLQRSLHHGKLGGNADLEDYALFALSLNRWIKLSGEQKFQQRFEQLLTYAWSNFFSEKGWKLSDDLLIPYGATEAMLADGPLPSPSGVMITLGLQSKNTLLRKQAQSAQQFGHNILINQPFWYASHIALLMNELTQSKH